MLTSNTVDDELPMLAGDAVEAPPKAHSVEQGITPVLAKNENMSGWLDRLAAAVGTNDHDVARVVARTLASSLRPGDDSVLNALIAEVQDMKPRDAMERALIMQALVVSREAMALMRDAVNSGLTELEAERAASAASLMRLFLQQMDCLRRMRNTEQLIRVTHVHADKAILGTVITKGGD